MSKRSGYIIILCSLVLISTSIQAAPEEESVIRLLEGRHWELNEEILLKLGDGTDEVLRKIADDSSLINYLRFRALEALSIFNNEKTATHLERMTRSEDPNLARRGFRSLSRGFSLSQPLRVKVAAQRLMQNPNDQVRIEAARVMKILDVTSFKNFLRTELKDWVRLKANQ